MEEIDFKWPNGFFADGIHAGLRKKRLDMGWVVSEVPAQSAGIYDVDNLVAIADVVLNFPTSKTAWLGLIMVDYDVVGQGIGGKIIEKLKQALMRERFKQLCTLVPIKSDVSSFFDAHGFLTGEEMPMGVREDGCEIVGKLRTVDLNIIK